MSEHADNERSERFRAEVAAAWAPSRKEDPVTDPPESHPEIDDLVAYQAGEMDEESEGRLHEHLMACPECLDRLSELEGFVEAGERGPTEVRDLDEAAAWRALRPRWKNPEKAPRKIPETESDPGSAKLPWTLAASFLVAALGMGLWAGLTSTEVTRLRGELAEHTGEARPGASVVHELFAGATQRVVDRDGDAHRLDLGTSGADQFTLLLHLPEAPEHDAYEAALHESTDEREQWRGTVYRDRGGVFPLTVPRSFLTADRYRITLYGLTGDRRQLLATYTLELAAQDASN